ncbi:hypothetical protein LTR62_008638 [Meristemomyces frigidus]|uniref:Zinc finger C2H2 LYAR-type domain-containing protein n=1 Tax=Meristemomyces frigidus TaxID=1508187 RepID=A0AAN7TKR4_9PEZI|nr:hypothetical protein LTR62_008638 [Meristemomyces frigidus]
MVSFSCENCGDVLTKKKLDPHRNQCYGASYTCLDCMTHFYGTEYRTHTSCISEAQKYQGALYRDKKTGNKRKSMNGNQDNNSQAMIPRNAYVEDAPDGEDSQAVAVVDVPPRAPTPPPAHEPSLENVNVFDFLITDATPSRKEIEPTASHKMIPGSFPREVNRDSQYSQYSDGNGTHFAQSGFSYGQAPVHATFERYDSWQNMTDSQGSQSLMPPPPYTTPGPKSDKADRKERKLEKSDKKRKRQQVEDLDLSSSKRPTSRGDEPMMDMPANGSASRVLHSGLTGGLTRLVTDPDFYEDRIDAGPTPVSPLKRSKLEKDVKDARRKSSYTSYSTTKSASSKHAEDRHTRARSKDRSESKSSKHHHRSRRGSSSSPESQHQAPKREYKAIEYQPARPSSVQPTANNQLVAYHANPELFLSFITKGPDSERGLSINKALKRYHRERDTRSGEKEEEDKDLWKSLRLRRNDRGEIVLFVG